MPIKDESIEDFTKDGACSKCGACCSTFLPLTAAELRRLRNWVRKRDYKPEPVGDALDITCPFLDKETTRCACYEARPEVCQKFLCKTMHDGNQIQLSKPQRRYTVVNLREAIFKEESMSLQDFMLFNAYLKQRKEAENE